MNKLILASIIASVSSAAQAELKMYIPLEKNSIKFTDRVDSNWIATTPLESEWINVSDPTNCTNWSPELSTVPLGEIFTQTATDCVQNQTRTIQQREQETTTLAIRNVGIPVYENQTISATDTREAEGTAENWNTFADARSLSKDWNILNWQSQSLTKIPNAPYPLTNVTFINLYTNQLKNVDGFSNIEKADSIALNDNQLTNVDGLSNLTSVNNITLNNNQLTNINGLRNVKVSFVLRIDQTYSGPKLAASTRFCSLNAPSVFSIGYAQKSQLCQ